VRAANRDDDKAVLVTAIGFFTALFPDDYEAEPYAAIASWLQKVYRQLRGAKVRFW
jgi:hypothetical protein